MAGEPERAGGSADAALPGRTPLCLARNCLTVRQFGPLESIDPNDAMILPHGANLDRMKFSERTGLTQGATARLGDLAPLRSILRRMAKG
jgi:hypothetical protein